MLNINDVKHIGECSNLTSLNHDKPFRTDVGSYIEILYIYIHVRILRFQTAREVGANAVTLTEFPEQYVDARSFRIGLCLFLLLGATPSFSFGQTSPCFEGFTSAEPASKNHRLSHGL